MLQVQKRAPSQETVCSPLSQEHDSIALYYISLYLGWEHRNPNMNNKDHIVGQLTKSMMAFSPRLMHMTPGLLITKVVHGHTLPLVTR